MHTRVKVVHLRQVETQDAECLALLQGAKLPDASLAQLRAASHVEELERRHTPHDRARGERGGDRDGRVDGQLRAEGDVKARQRMRAR